MKISIKKRRFLPKILIVVFILGLLLFFLNFFQKQIQNFFYFISTPIQKIFWGIGDRVSDFFISFIKTGNLKREMENLKFKNQELLAEIAALKELKKENETLRQALEIGLKKEFKLDLVQIIGKDIGQDFILIDRGREGGVLENMPVITQQKILVGKVLEVYKNFSKVMLISNKKSSFDGKLQEKDISGLVKGQGNFKIIFDLVPRDAEISQEDLVVTSALGGIFPPGILIGQIKDIRKSDVEPFLQIDIKPAFEITEINNLFLLTKY